MDEETKLAIEMRDAISALAKKCEAHEHLTHFSSSLMEVVEEIDSCIEDIEGVE